MEGIFFGYSIYELFFIFLFWGIAGWLIEVVDMRIEAGEFQNRGFLHIPLCPMYGLGMAFASASLSSVRDSYLILFVFGVVFCSLAEYIVGGILERLFHTKWWDYSHMRFHIKGRVCLRNAILFGFAAILVLHFIEPMVEKAIDKIPVGVGIFGAMVFGTVLVIDVVVSVRKAWAYRKSQTDQEVRQLFKSHR